jgi:hypothetical protein
MHRFALLFTTIALISAHGIVAHGQQPLTRKQIMESADKNRDSKIGRIEFLERMREAFFFVDVNKDSVLTIAEYQRI